MRDASFSRLTSRKRILSGKSFSLVSIALFLALFLSLSLSLSLSYSYILSFHMVQNEEFLWDDSDGTIKILNNICISVIYAVHSCQYLRQRTFRMY